MSSPARRGFDIAHHCNNKTENESLKLEETAHDFNVMPVMGNYDQCGPETRTFVNDLKASHSSSAPPL